MPGVALRGREAWPRGRGCRSARMCPMGLMRAEAGARSRRQLGERPIGSGGDYLKGEAVGSGRIHVCIERGTGGQPSCGSSHQVSRLIPSGAAPRVSCTLARRLFVPEKISRNKQAFELLWCHRGVATRVSLVRGPTDALNELMRRQSDACCACSG